METKWICPECQTTNLDDWMLTAFPVCENCNKEIWWEDILTGQNLENYLLNSEA